MNSSTKFLAIVISVSSLVPAITFAEGAAGTAGISFAPQDPAVDNNRACLDMINKAKEAKKKFLGTCKASGAGKSVTDCSDVLSDCEENEAPDSADDVSFPQTMIKTLGIPMADVADQGKKPSNKCSAYSYTDFKSEMKDLKQAKKDNEKDLRDLQEKRVSESEKFTDKKKAIMEAYQQNQKDYDDEQYKNQEEERSIQKTQKDALDKYSQELRTLQAKALEIQNSRALQVMTQGSVSTKYKNDISACETQALALAKQQQSNTAGSLGSIKNKPKEVWKTCVQGVLDARKAQDTAYQGKMAEYNQQLQDVNSQIVEVQKNIQMLNTQSAQASQDRTAKAQKSNQAFVTKQQQKMTELQELSAQTTTRISQLEDAINKANVAIQQTTAEVTDFQKEKPASKGSKNYREDMSTAQAEWLEYSKCTTMCSKTKNADACAEISTDASKKDKSSKSSKSSSSHADGADGK